MEQLEAAVKKAAAARPKTAPPPAQPSGIVTSQALSPPREPLPSHTNWDSEASRTSEQEVDRGEFWLNRIGIGLLLLGLAFLFKYSIDQNWLTPWVRVSFGLVLGSSLIGFGLRLNESRRVLSQILLGGGIASFYVSGFAAFQLYHLVPHPMALSFMVGATLLSFYLALYQNEPPLAVVAVVGGLATPFILHTGSGNIPGLIVYTCLVLAGSMAIFLFPAVAGAVLVLVGGRMGGAGYRRASTAPVDPGTLALFLERPGRHPVHLDFVLDGSHHSQEGSMATLNGRGL
ncbi:MAG: DUF2339 domain-containing protein [Nitrospinaceae bacterium]|nr:DUF2339 domain-containing protein [Nitrospinaceae bacterium]NIR57738.1 DUF2339 domain-containing protein [Nitrospinaceae bacterium]NIS88198.1 DUF2339 domain-containing protein [Nitrospinaceae bacterium]NIT85082.1 DUF2339 domain-containing protein [Nitrospinaceae bacterium]NIU47236.1 DUF2339 domain-containing protein [Nitrospinaceae bacterium]